MSRNANEVRRQRRRENAGKRLKLCSRCKRVLEKVRRSSGEWRDDDYDAKTAVRSVSADLSGSSPSLSRGLNLAGQAHHAVAKPLHSAPRCDTLVTTYAARLSATSLRASGVMAAFAKGWRRD
jgi:hypothetical protein